MAYGIERTRQEITVQNKAQEAYFQITEWSEHERDKVFMLEARPQLGPSIALFHLDLHRWVVKNGYTFCFP